MIVLSPDKTLPTFSGLHDTNFVLSTSNLPEDLMEIPISSKSLELSLITFFNRFQYFDMVGSLSAFSDRLLYVSTNAFTLL